MKKHIASISLLIIGILGGVIGQIHFNEPIKTEAAVGNHSTDINTYYSSITAKSGKQLLGQLHDLITSTHETYPSYDDSGSNGYQKITDQWYENDTAVSGSIREFYSGIQWANDWDASSGRYPGGYNREHVWPKSLSNGLWDSSSPSHGGADMHHIRPSECDINSTRNNNLYGEVSNRDSYQKYVNRAGNKTYALGGYLNGVFEPIDTVKGDVARIVLYVYTHYNTYSNAIFGDFATTNGSIASNKIGNISLNSVVKASSDQAAAELMLKWSEDDPVDYMEMQRNEAIAKYQGNRNPFIDHPEYIDAIWGDTPLGEEGSGDDPVTPPTTVNVTSVTLNKSSLTLNVGDTSTLSATVYPTNATDKSVTWSSNNTSVATVSNGIVSANAAGTATITVKTSDGNKTATCNVTVNTSQVTPPISGNVTYEKVTSISDVTSGDKVIVAQKDSEGKPTNGVTGWNGNKDATINQSDESTWVQYEVENDTNGWYLKDTKANTYIASPGSSNQFKYGTKAICSVNADGVLMCNGRYLTANGTYYRMYTSIGSYVPFYVWKVTSGGSSTPVIPELESLTMSETNIILDIGDTLTLTATPYPSDAEYALTWTSSNKDVASVENGLVTALKAGTTTITAASGNIKATCQVTVNEEEVVVPPVTPSGDESFVKVTTNSELTDGDYLIVYEGDSVAFNGGLTTLDAISNTITVSPTNGEIEADSITKAATFTIDVDDKTIKSASGIYIGRSSDSNGLESDTKALTHIKLEIEDGNFVAQSSGNAYLRYNANSGQDRFRYFKSSTYGSQKAIQLYKLVSEVDDHQVVQDFVDTYMHMSDASGNGNGYCISKGWYNLAKAAFVKLTKEQKHILSTEFIDAFNRLEAWAIANGESIIYQDGDYIIDNVNNPLQIITNENNSLILIICVVIIGTIIVILGISSKKRQRK